MTRPDDQAGSVTLWATVMMVALFAAAGMVLDGGQAMAAKGRAVADAYGAARAGADALNRSQLAQGGPATPDPVAAGMAARQFLTQSGVDPARATVTVTGAVVTVGVEIREPTRLLGVVGVDHITVTGHGSARPSYRLVGGGP